MNIFCSLFQYIKNKCSSKQENQDIMNYRIEQPFIGDDECIICLGEYNQGQNISLLFCGHRFHKPCIEYWFKYKKTCPLCDIEIKP